MSDDDPKAEFSPDGRDVWVPRERWTPAMACVADYVARVGSVLLSSWARNRRNDVATIWPVSDTRLEVRILSDVTLGYAACYSVDGGIVFNLGRLGHAFFDACKTGPTVQLNDLVLHELAHDFEDSHLSDGYHEALSRLGAKLVALALGCPGWFSW